MFSFRIILARILFSERSQCVTTELQQSGDKSMDYEEQTDYGWLVVLRLNVPVNNFSVMSGRTDYGSLTGQYTIDS